jgi:hypothetical protein
MWTALLKKKTKSKQWRKEKVTSHLTTGHMCTCLHASDSLFSLPQTYTRANTHTLSHRLTHSHTQNKNHPWICYRITCACIIPGQQHATAGKKKKKRAHTHTHSPMNLVDTFIWLVSSFSWFSGVLSPGTQRPCEIFLPTPADTFSWWSCPKKKEKHYK